MSDFAKKKYSSYYSKAKYNLQVHKTNIVKKKMNNINICSTLYITPPRQFNFDTISYLIRSVVFFGHSGSSTNKTLTPRTPLS